MADKTFEQARQDNELVPGTPGANQQQITGTEVLGSTSSTSLDSGVRTVSLQTYAVNGVKADADWMSKSVYDGNGNGLVNGAEKVDDGTNSTSAAQVAGHIADLTLHRTINDVGSTTTDLWSANKITSELGLKADTASLTAHTGDTSIHTPLNDAASTASNLWSASKISGELANKVDTATLNAHTGDLTIHRVLDDAQTTLTNLWSASKISGDIGLKLDTSVYNAHAADLQIHAPLNDAQTLTTNVWSGSKINTELAVKAPSSHVGDSTHLSTTERAAITNMPNPPTAVNPFASQADISAGSKHVIQDETTTFPDQPNLKFQGAGVTVTNDVPGTATVVSIPGGSGGGIEEAPIDGGFYSRRNAIWENSPQTPTGGLSLNYTYISATGAADPGTGNVGLSSANPALATSIYISNTTGGGVAANPVWASWKTGDYIALAGLIDGNGQTYQLTGNPISNAGGVWWTIPVSGLVTTGALALGAVKVMMVEDPTARVFVSDINYTNLNANGSVGTGSTQVAQGDHLHPGVYEPVLGNPATDGYVLSSTIAGVRTWVPQSGGGSLTDAEFPTYAVFSSKITGAAAINFASGNKQEVNATTSPAVTVTSPAGHPANFILVILNSGSLTSIAPAAGGSILWENGTPPSWAGTSVLALYYDGSAWYGSAMVNVS